MSSGSGGQRILAGRYRLDEVIGRGGMSTVYRGTDLALNRVVAVKVALDPLAEENPVHVARFKREAHAAAALSNPGVVTVYDAGADGPTRYIVMEFVEGKSLAELLRENGPVEPARAADIAEQVADALAAAHAAGIVHRDIKPGNVMVGPDDRVKVLDFGIAHTADAVTLTQTASVLGTAPYMSPEQAMGNPADARSDIYSLGCVLFEMLTGTPPFMADVPAAVMHQQVRVPPKAPSALNPEVPPELDALVLQMLAKRPEDRPQTAAEVRDRLEAYRTGTVTEPTRPLPPPVEALAAAAAVAADVPQVATVPEVAPVAQVATVPPKATAARGVPPSPPPSPPSRRRLWAALAAICVVLFGAGVAYAIAGGGSSGSSSSQSHPAATATVTVTHDTTNATTHPNSTPSTPSTPTTSSTASSSSTPTSSSSSTSSSTTTVTTTATAPATGGVSAGQATNGTTTK